MSATMPINHGQMMMKGLFQPSNMAEINHFLELFEKWQFEKFRKQLCHTSTQPDSGSDNP